MFISNSKYDTLDDTITEGLGGLRKSPSGATSGLYQKAVTMDSITQIALGAAIGEATLGRQVGKRAILWGGLCGLFPDLDILIPLGDAVKNFTYHRGPSHSLVVLSALTPLFVYLIIKCHPDTRQYRKRWFALVFLAFITHVLLDCFTVYGTQIFWPLPTPPVMWPRRAPRPC